MRGSWSGLTYLVLGAGMLLRLWLTLAWPAEAAYDDHYEPVRVILTQHRLPDASDCWECFQPPLYYLLGAGVETAAQYVVPGAADEPERLGREVLQAISLASGCATLVICLWICRRLRLPRELQPLGLGLVAFLPRHVYMSAMATNDALTCFVATGAIHAGLRAHAGGWKPAPTLAAGALAGAAVLGKGYGWVTPAALLIAAWLATRRVPTPSGTTPPRRPWLWLTPAILAVGIWPTVRNLTTFDRFHVDNFDLRDSPMRFQPPQSRAALSLASFRLPALMRHPWLHTAHADSFFTELYGRTWFDYEGFKTSLAPYPPWQALWNRCAQACPQWNRVRWDMLLSYRDDEVPPGLRTVARITYAAGLPLTLALLAGAVLTLRHLGRDFPRTLLLLHLLFALGVPLVQTLRLPHFSAMKAAYALSGLATLPLLAVALPLALPAGRPRHAATLVLALALLIVAGADGGFVLLVQRLHAAGAG